MLRVTIEFLPGGFGPAQHLGTAVIANDGTGTPQLGNYTVRLSKRGKPGQAWKRGTVQGFPRQALGPYDLLYRCLEATVGRRQGGRR